MSSLRRISSSRANGALSRGPVTLEGKQRSAMNALSHGLLARTTLMRGEWAAGLEGLLTEHVDRLAPVDAVEYGYVEEMVVARWRLRRLWAIETRTLDNEADAQTADDPLDRIAAAFAQLAEKTSSGSPPPLRVADAPYLSTRFAQPHPAAHRR